MELNNIDNIQEWSNWKKTLGKAVNFGETVGLSEDTMSKVALKVGNFLSTNVDPENREQRVIKELWDAGDEEDRKYLSKLMVKIVENER